MARTKTPTGIQVRKRSDGTFAYKAWIPGGRRGARIWSKRTYDSLADAVKIRAAMLEKSATIPLEAVTFGHAVERTEKELEVDCRPGTLKWYRSHKETLLRDFGAATQVARITRADIERARDRWIETDKVSPVTVGHRRRALSRTLSTVADALEVNPLTSGKGVRWPKARPEEKKPFSADEVAVIVEAIRGAGKPDAEEDASIVEVLFTTALRRSELARVEVSHVDLQQGTLWIDGKKRSEVVHLTPAAVSALERMVDRVKDGPLVPGGADRVSRVFPRWSTPLAKILKGRPFTPHLMRHSFISCLASTGMDVHTFMKYSRIETMSVAQGYVHSVRRNEAELADVANAIAPSRAPRSEVVQSSSARPALRRVE